MILMLLYIIVFRRDLRKQLKETIYLQELFTRFEGFTFMINFYFQETLISRFFSIYKIISTYQITVFKAFPLDFDNKFFF